MESSNTSEDLELTTICNEQALNNYDKEIKNDKEIKRLGSLQPVELAAEGNLTELTTTINILDIDHKYQFGFTLLHYAAKENRVEVIEYLVTSGCDVNAVDDDGQTPLYKSAMFGHQQSVQLLIDKGADVNKVDNNGNTPLHVAIMSGGGFNIIKALLKKADPCIQNNDNQNVLHVAVKHHKVDNIDLFLNHKQAAVLIATTDKDGLTPLLLAVSLGHLDTTERFLKLPKMNTFVKTHQGKNIIHLAAATNDAILLSLLLDSHDTLHLINEADNMLSTPLHDAADKGQLKQVEILLDRGAMIKSTIDGYSPLHYACLQGHLNIAKKLSERHPFQINLSTHNKDTPLHLAARSSHAAIVKFLLDSGASITHNKQQASFLDLALFNWDCEVATVTVKHKRWQECLDFISPIHPAPIISLIRNIPEVAQIVMDHSITSAKLHPTHPCYWKHYDFKYILDMPKDSEDVKNSPRSLLWFILHYLQFLLTFERTNNSKPLKVIRTMYEFKRCKLYTHPLLLAFLNLKWIKYGRLYIQIRAATLVLLTMLLTLLITISDPPRKYIDAAGQNITSCNDSNISQSLKMSDNDDNISQSLKIIVLVIDAVYTLLLIVQVTFFIRLRKIFHPGHFCFEVASVICTAVFLITEPTKWIAAVGALFCSWVALNLFSRYLDVFGLYTIMFYELLFKILKVMLVGLYYIIGCGLILYILIGEETLYDHPIKAVCAAFFYSISRLSVDVIGTKEEEDTLQYPIATYAMILLFNIVLPMTLINLLIGIAVFKIGAIQDGALRYQAELKIRLFLELDPIIPEILQYKIYPKRHKVKGSSFEFSMIGGMWNRITSFFAYNDEPERKEVIVMNQKDNEIQEVINRISQLENQIECILKILTTDSRK